MDDIRHILWLIKNAIKCILVGNFKDAYEAVFLIKLHLVYSHRKY